MKSFEARIAAFLVAAVLFGIFCSPTSATVRGANIERAQAPDVKRRILLK